MKKLHTWLIMIGIIIILIPIGGKIYMQHEQQKMYEEYKSQIESDMMDVKFKDEVITAPAVEEKKEIQGVIGRIKIPSISCDLLLLEGSSSRELGYGAGHVLSTAMPGQVGNCAIAGHRDYTFGTYFSRLDEVNINDIVEVEYQGSTYSYQVSEILTVEPTETSVLSQPSDQTMLTLITCTPKGSSKYRLIVHAKLI